MIMSKKAPLILVLLLVGTFGCGRGRGEATGTVSGTATLDGKAVAEGCVVVCQHVKNALSAGGKIEKDGSFMLLMQDGPSLIVGDYKVLIQPPGLNMKYEEAMKLSMQKKLPKLDDSVVPAKYRSFDKSKLFLIVKEGSNPPFEIKMESSPAK